MGENVTTPLDDIESRVAAGEPLTEGDIDALVGTRDLLGLGSVADAMRRARRGQQVTFVRVVAVPVDAEPPAIPPGAGEVRIVGCPDDPDAALRVTRHVRAAAGEVPVTGFALDDLVEACGEDTHRVAELVGALREAGLALVAEARVDRARDPRWIELAAAAGLPVARLTVIGREAEAGTWARRVASWRSAVGSVRAFAPLPRVAAVLPTTGYADVRQVALARLLVDNIDSIQVDWSVYGPKLAQVALAFGADDVDAVSPIDSTELGWRRAPLEEIVRNISAAGLAPVQRNGRFEIGTAS